MHALQRKARKPLKLEPGNSSCNTSSITAAAACLFTAEKPPKPGAGAARKMGSAETRVRYTCTVWMGSPSRESALPPAHQHNPVMLPSSRQLDAH